MTEQNHFAYYSSTCKSLLLFDIDHSHVESIEIDEQVSYEHHSLSIWSAFLLYVE